MAAIHEIPPKTYEEAVHTLNTLQSNASVIEKVKAERHKHRDRNLPETLEFSKRIGITLDDLDKLNIIHVSGTKGKGSTCSFCESILRSHGYKTGFYSSPHLIEVRERIRINGQPLSKDLFSSYFWQTYSKLDSSKDEHEEAMPSYFRFLTLMAFEVFIKEEVDVAIIEVGIGGQYDCTNIIRSPVVCGVSSLGMDHMGILGDTIDKIAWNKAGIFKAGVPAVTVPQPDDSIRVLIERAQEIGAPLSLIPALEDYDWGDRGMQLGIHGQIQHRNASLALQLCKIWLQDHDKDVDKRKNEYDMKLLSDIQSISHSATFRITPPMAAGLRNCRWPGRAQTIKKSGVTYFMDGAHTPRSLQQCVAWFKEASSIEAKDLKSSNITKVLIFNATGDRKPETLLEDLAYAEFDCALFCPNIASLAGNSADQTNLTVTVDSQLSRCIRNMSAYKELVTLHTKTKQSGNPAEKRSGAVSPIVNGSGDHIKQLENTQTVNNNQGSEKQENLNTKLADKNLSKTVIKTSDNSLVPCFAFTSIQEALTLLTEGRVRDFPICSHMTTQDVPTVLREAEHVQVLCTGSLHLVGGLLQLLDPQLNENV